MATEQVDEATLEESSTFRGQASYDASRRERKALAAETMKANAEEAQKAKAKAQAKGFTVKGAAAFDKRAKEIEAQHEARRKAKK